MTKTLVPKTQESETQELETQELEEKNLDEVVEENQVEQSEESSTQESTTEETEVETQETETEESKDKPEAKPVAEEPTEPKKESLKARNMRLLARAKDKLARDNQRLEKEKDELKEIVEEYKKNKNTDAFDDDLEDDYAKKNNALVQQNDKIYKQMVAMQADQQRLAQQISLDKAEQRILKQYSDFADVVSATNVSILEELDPEVTKEIVAEQDIYKKAVRTYDAIRDHKIYDTANEIASNRQAIIDNIAKPKTAASSPKINKSNSSVFADLHSKDFQNQLRRELEESKSKV